jgi:hypothetical protein
MDEFCPHFRREFCGELPWRMVCPSVCRRYDVGLLIEKQAPDERGKNSGKVVTRRRDYIIGQLLLFLILTFIFPFRRGYQGCHERIKFESVVGATFEG